jgi:hypothetical protein
VTRDPTKPDLTPEERALLCHLHRYCRGARNARTYEQLQEVLALKGVHVASRGMYDLIAGLVLKSRPVGTTSGLYPGAFIVCDGRDARIAYRNLYGRVFKMLKRCRAFKRTIREGLNRQEFLDLDDHVAGSGKKVGGQAVLFTDAARGSMT